MYKGRVIKLAYAIQSNPERLIKLNAASVGLAAAIGKLYSHYKMIHYENKKDIAFFQEMERAFIECASIDLEFSEKFMDVSKEADEIFKLELNQKDEHQ